MKFAITVTRRARQEALEVLNYYDDIQLELSEDFLADLEERLNAICENPYAYSYIDNKSVLRDVILNRFPYLIIFKIKLNEVIVVSIHNRYKRPKSF